MIRFARQEAEKEGAAVEWVVGDMRDFQLPTRVDLACCLFDSIDGVRSIDDFIRQFQAGGREPRIRWHLRHRTESST